jgi:hypothetical protein
MKDSQRSLERKKFCALGAEGRAESDYYVGGTDDFCPLLFLPLCSGLHPPPLPVAITIDNSHGYLFSVTWALQGLICLLSPAWHSIWTQIKGMGWMIVLCEIFKHLRIGSSKMQLSKLKS